MAEDTGSSKCIQGRLSRHWYMSLNVCRVRVYTHLPAYTRSSECIQGRLSRHCYMSSNVCRMGVYTYPHVLKRLSHGRIHVSTRLSCRSVREMFGRFRAILGTYKGDIRAILGTYIRGLYLCLTFRDIFGRC